MKDKYRLRSPAEGAAARCAAVAARQFGLVSRAQALAAGMSARMIAYRIRTGEWIVVLPGIYRVAAVPITWKQKVMGACLYFDGAGAACRATAAALHRFPGFREELPIEIATSTSRKSPRKRLVVRRVKNLERADVVFEGPIPVTHPARTVFDLVPDLDEEALEDLVDHVLRKGLASLPRLRWTLQRLGGKGRSGTAIFRKLLDERQPGYVPTHSRMEIMLDRLIRKSDLAKPVRQHVVKNRTGGFVAQPDFAYVDLKIAIDAVSYDYHHGRLKQRKDIERRNRLIAEGWIVLEFTWEQIVNDPDYVIATIRDAIRQRAAG